MKQIFRKLGYFFLYSLIILAFIYLGTKDYNLVTYNTDGERFNSDYNEIPRNNPFVYLNSTELINLLNNGSGIVFMGNHESVWSLKYATFLYEVLKAKDIDEVYYYDVKKVKLLKNRNYYNIIKELEGNLIETDDSDKNLFSPSLYIIKDGEVVFYDNTTAVVNNNIDVEDYWTETNIYNFKDRLINAFNENDC